MEQSRDVLADVVFCCWYIGERGDKLIIVGGSSPDAANAFLPSFVADYNTRFAKPPANPKDLHRPMTQRDNLEDEFTWQEERTLSQALTLQYDKVLFILEPSEAAQAAIGKRVTVVDYPDGRIAIRNFPWRTSRASARISSASRMM
jgi:hypothetical protein